MRHAESRDPDDDFDLDAEVQKLIDYGNTKNARDAARLVLGSFVRVEGMVLGGTGNAHDAVRSVEGGYRDRHGREKGFASLLLLGGGRWGAFLEFL